MWERFFRNPVVVKLIDNIFPESREKNLIEKYENEHFPIELPDPIEAIKFRMEQLNFSQNDLAEVIGLKSRASEILNKKRKLSLDMIRKLTEKLHIPSEVLIQAY